MRASCVGPIALFVVLLGTAAGAADVVGRLSIPAKTGNLSVRYLMAVVRGNETPEEGMLRQLGAYRDAGLSAVEDYPCLAAIAREKGELDWSYYDNNERAVHAAGLSYAVYPWLHFAPEWMWESGQLVPYVSLDDATELRMPSIWAPSTLALYDWFYEKLAEHFGERIDYICLSLPSDYGEVGYPAGMADWVVPVEGVKAAYWCGDRMARADFRAWALRKYADFEGLNHAWGTQYASEVDIDYPEDRENARRWLDFVAWYYESQTEFARKAVGVVRTHFPGVPIEIKIGYGEELIVHGSDNSGIPKMCAEEGVKLHSTHGTCHYVLNKRLSTASRFYGAVHITEPPGGVKPDVEVDRIFTDVSCGTDELFDYPGNFLGAREVFATYAPLLTGEDPLVDVALFFPTSYHRMHPDENFPMRYWDAGVLLRDGTDYDVIDEAMMADGALAGYKVLMAPEAGIVEADALQKLAEWVEGGGVLVVNGGDDLATREGSFEIAKLLLSGESVGAGTVYVNGGDTSAAGFAAFATGVLEATDASGVTLGLDRRGDGVHMTLLPSKVVMFNTNGVAVAVSVSLPEGMTGAESPAARYQVTIPARSIAWIDRRSGLVGNAERALESGRNVAAESAAPIAADGFNSAAALAQWEVEKGDAAVEAGRLVLGPSSSARWAGVELSGDYSIEWQFQADPGEAGWVGLVFNSGAGPGELMFYVWSHGSLGLHSPALGFDLMRAFPALRPAEEPVRIKLCVYGRGRRITYWVDGRFYGERLLDHKLDPQLTGGGVTLCTLDTGASFDFIRADRIEGARAVPPLQVAESDAAAPATESVFPRSDPPAGRLDYVDATSMSPADQFTSVVLQGLANRAAPCVYTNYSTYEMGDVGEDWSRLLTDRGHELVPVADVTELLERHRSVFRGAVIYDPRAWDNRNHPGLSHQINVAMMLCALSDAIPLTPEQYGEHGQGLPVVLDTRGRWESAVDAYRWAWERLRPECTDRAVCHIEPQSYTLPLRDYLVRNRIFTFYASEPADEVDYRFYLSILASTPPNTPIMGITSLGNRFGPPSAVFDEDCLFRTAAELGKFFLYTHSTANLSVHSGVRVDRLRQRRPAPRPEPRDKVYVAFLCSDGDNLTWAMNLRAKIFRNPDRAGVPKGWGIPAAMVELCPAVLKYYYENASENDYFFCEGSGFADHYDLSRYGARLPEEARRPAADRFLDITERAMAEADLSVIRLFDGSYPVSRATVDRYAVALPSLLAVFTGYNGEPGGVTYEQASFVARGVPVFRTLGTSTHACGPEADARFLAQRIRSVTPAVRPAFINVFVLGNYVIDSCECLSLAMEMLGDDYVAARPDHFAKLYLRCLDR